MRKKTTCSPFPSSNGSANNSHDHNDNVATRSCRSYSYDESNEEGRSKEDMTLLIHPADALPLLALAEAVGAAAAVNACLDFITAAEDAVVHAARTTFGSELADWVGAVRRIARWPRTFPPPPIPALRQQNVDLQASCEHRQSVHWTPSDDHSYKETTGTMHKSSQIGPGLQGGEDVRTPSTTSRTYDDCVDGEHESSCQAVTRGRQTPLRLKGSRSTTVDGRSSPSSSAMRANGDHSGGDRASARMISSHVGTDRVTQHANTQVSCHMPHHGTTNTDRWKSMQSLPPPSQLRTHSRNIQAPADSNGGVEFVVPATLWSEPGITSHPSDATDGGKVCVNGYRRIVESYPTTDDPYSSGDVCSSEDHISLKGDGWHVEADVYGDDSSDRWGPNLLLSATPQSVRHQELWGDCARKCTPAGSGSMDERCHCCRGVTDRCRCSANIFSGAPRPSETIPFPARPGEHVRPTTIGGTATTEAAVAFSSGPCAEFGREYNTYGGVNSRDYGGFLPVSMLPPARPRPWVDSTTAPAAMGPMPTLVSEDERLCIQARKRAMTRLRLTRRRQEMERALVCADERNRRIERTRRRAAKVATLLSRRHADTQDCNRNRNSQRDGGNSGGVRETQDPDEWETSGEQRLLAVSRVMKEGYSYHTGPDPRDSSI